MQTRTKVLNIFSLIFSIAVLAASVFGFIYIFQDSDYAGIGEVFSNASVISAAVACIASLVMIPFNIIAICKGKSVQKSGIPLFKLAAAALSAAVLIGVFVSGLGIIPDDINENFTNPDIQAYFFSSASGKEWILFLHLIVPALSIISFIFVDVDTKASFADTLAPLGSSMLYIGAFHLIFYVVYYEEDTNVFPYQFLAPVLDNGEIDFVPTLLIPLGIALAVWVVSILLWLLNKLFHHAYGFDQLDTKPNNNAIATEAKPEPEEKKEEPKPVVEKKKEEPKKEVVKPAPKVEEPKKEEKPTIIEVQKAILVKETPKEETKPAVEEKKEEPKPAPKVEQPKPAPKVEEPKKEATPKAAPKKNAPVSNKARTASKKVNTKETPIARVYHISRHTDGGWKVKLAGGEKAIKIFPTQNEAIAYAKQLVNTQGGSLRIHSMDGSIRKG